MGKVLADRPGIAQGKINYLYILGATEAKWRINDQWELAGAVGVSWNNSPKQLVKGDNNTNISLGGIRPYFSTELRYLF